MCRSCGWIGDDAELLRAPSPFDVADTICGCPQCKAVNDVVNACDEPGCAREATCGFPDPGGYRRTCVEHVKWRNERPNVIYLGDLPDNIARPDVNDATQNK
jgi:hypothetical protein